MATAWLGLGTNVGERERHLAHALRALAREPDVELTGMSTVYETEPVGYTEQPRFLNMVARVDTALAPDALLVLARRLERERGRERTVRNGPRTLDVDILLYDDRRIDRPGLTIPHPRMRDRPFVLVPLLELDPELLDPATGRSLREEPAASPTPGMRALGRGEALLGREHEDGEALQGREDEDGEGLPGPEDPDGEALQRREAQDDGA